MAEYGVIVSIDPILYEEILSKAMDAVWVIDEENNIVYLNPAAEVLTSYSYKELVGRSFSTLIPTSYSINHKEIIKKYINNEISDSKVLNKIREFYILSKDKVAIPIELKAFQLEHDSNGKHLFAAIMRDNRPRKQLEENQRMAMATLKKLAFIDELTMIPNRRSFYESFRKLLAGLHRHSRDAVIAVIDIDNFKEINDTYGHDVGDMVLKNVSNVFLENLREEDIVGRIGGEEFGFLLPETDEVGAQIVLERLRLSVKRYRFFVFENFYLNVTISAGYTKVNPKQSIEEIIKCADIALYQAKSSGRDAIEKFLD
ncbi:MAG: GGDEF domain-containing protein [Leptospira sp.]|nr:GGDEF domain-containing protein [Leptospira sp.]